MKFPGWLLMFLLAAYPVLAEVERIPLTIAGKGFEVELAVTDEARRRGLMHRKELGGDHGMLFIFPEPGMYAMWMRNTHIPLSVAFLDERGVIVNIVDMEPHSEELRGAIRPAKYVLEMNRGWFAKRGIKAGARLEAGVPLPEGE